ncbi:hypothetical protein [Pelagicoccus sp. SDUM812002]|uniref:hypothetical protein n=1 Tax=Pelagicoccus sp. SDUM812002 TaxID=3041266 RepID=UPI00280C81D7|nr:hypothetical protein [Pelagicoccus sp. SDUM812002]MDQ8184000.1 hypothetical protein [Pelagicoccus sp. SDUM812002]
MSANRAQAADLGNLQTYTCFSVSWVIASLFHMLHRSDIVATPLSMVTAASAGYLLLKPDSLNRFLAFCVLHATLYLDNAPNTGNHEFFAFCCECYITSMIVASRLGVAGADWATSWKRHVLPGLKGLLITLYVFAVLQKLNTCYLSPDSCGGTLLWDYAADHPFTASLAASLPSDANWFRQTSIFSSLGIELLIPVLLLIPRLAWIGAILGLVFHFLLGFFYFWHFTPVLYAMYILFLPETFQNRLFSVIERVCSHEKVRWLLVFCIIALPILYGLKGSIKNIEWEIGSFSRGARNGWEFGLNVRTLFGWLPFCVYTFLLGLFVFREGRGYQKPNRTGTSLWSVAAIALVAFNGLCPYLGLKTHQAFSMFSGLTVGDNQTNHLFMPVLPLSPDGLDLLYPLGEDFTSHSASLRWAPDVALPLFELRRRISMLKEEEIDNIRLSYSRGGVNYETANAELDPELAAPVGWFGQTFRIYRPVPIDDCSCQY